MNREPNLERRIVERVFWRLIPLLFACFVAAFIDRVNVGFAKLSMLVDLRLSETAYAAGAGIFFVGYFLFEVPSNALLVKFGPRLWIARIMVVWGFVSAAMAFVSGEKSFYFVRFLLGAAEAGFFPGVIYLLSIWFPRAYRARATASFLVAAVFSFIVGNPLSGWLMDHPMLGLASWQWLFVVEAVPSLLLGCVVLLALPDSPADATWLTPSEREWLLRRLATERGASQVNARTLRQVLATPRVWHLSAIYFFNVVGGYGLDFFAPTLLARAYPGLSKTELGSLLAVPALVTIPLMVLYGRYCDKHDSARGLVALAGLVFAVGLATLALPLPAWVTLLALTLCSASRWSLIGPFWALPGAVRGGTGSALGIAFINSVGNLGGQAGPLLLSVFKDDSGSYARGLWVLCACLAICAWLAWRLPPRCSHVTPGPAAAEK